MKFEHTSVSNLDNAFRGMRNPLASWKKSDSAFGICKYDNLRDYEVAAAWIEKLYPEMDRDSDEFYDKEDSAAAWLRDEGLIKTSEDYNYGEYAFIGPNDMDLAMRLCAGGSEHRKFLRQIQVSVDITAPLYWWKEFDTYKVGTAANSTSTMHKLASTPISLQCFEIDDYEPDLVVYDENDWRVCEAVDDLILDLERLRLKYNETKDKRYWKELVRWLPNGWLQTRTVTMNYENLRSICHQREGHKLTEWHGFVAWTKTLPYAEQLIFGQPVELK